MFFVAEVVVDHLLRGCGALGDGVHAGVGKVLLDELRDGSLEDVLMGFLWVVS